MSFRFDGKYRWLYGALALVLVTIAVVLFTAKPKEQAVTNTADEARQNYAALYQAAWRQDNGQSPTLVTATLLVPPTIKALGLDNGRSSSEEQLWRIVEPLDASSIPVILTFDSVGDAVSDSVVQNGLILSVPDVTLSLEDWQSLITPTRVTNTSAAITSQMGIAIFRASAPINWNALGEVTLTLSGIAGQPDRTFSWTDPKVLLQL